MMTEREKLAKAIRCCMEESGCISCPLQDEICDEFYIEMTEVPTELLDRIEKELENRPNYRLN